jgi:hypothetical protein
MPAQPATIAVRQEYLCILVNDYGFSLEQIDEEVTYGDAYEEAVARIEADLSNGWSPQCFARPAEENEWGVLKLGAVSFGSCNDKENKALPPSLKADPVLEVRVGDDSWSTPG